MLLALLLVCEIPVERVALPIIENQRRLAPTHVDDVIIGIGVLIEGFRRGAIVCLFDVFDLLDPVP
jgi:hypothetical protein